MLAITTDSKKKGTMSKLITITLIGLLAGPAYAQVVTTAPTQSDSAQQPLFRVTVVGRTTAAINYRPRSGKTKVDFTDALPAASWCPLFI